MTNAIPTLKLLTFTSLLKPVCVGNAALQTMLRADRNLFARLAVVAQTCSLNMQEVFSYKLRPILWSLATLDGVW